MAGIAKRATIEIPIETNGLDRLDKLNSDLNRITDRNDSFRRSFADTSEQLSKFSDRAQEFGKKYRDMMEQSTTSNRDFAKASEEMSKRFNQTQKDMQDAINETKRTQRENTDSTVSDNERISRSHRNIGDEMDRNTDKMSSMKHAGHGLMMTGMNMTMAFGGFTAAAKQGIQEATNLQDQYNKVRILARNGGEQPQEARRNTGALQRQGQQLSTTYGIDQTQLSQGNEDLIRRGYTTSAARGAQPEYSKASLASGDDYNDVVKTGAGALEAFNQRTNNVQQMHNNTKQMLNQLTYGADLTASNYKDLGWAMQYVGSTAHQSHQSSNQTIAALGELSQQNITGTRAGTSLRRIIEGLDNPKANTLSSIGMNPKDLQDSHGNLKNISEDMQLIGQHMQGMSSVQRQNVFKSLFGMQGEQAAQILSSNSKQVDNLNQNIKNAPNMNNGEGYNTSVASQNMQSFKGQSNIAKQNFKAMETSIAGSMLPDLAKMVGWANNIFRKINSMSKSQKRLVGWGSLVIAGIGPVILGIGSLTASISSISHAMHKLRGVFSRKMPRTATNSMASQAAENSVSSEAMQSSSNGGSSIGSYGSGELSRANRLHPHTTGTATEEMDHSGFGLGNTARESSSFTRDAEGSSKLLSGVGKIGNLTSVVSMAIPLLSMLNGKNTGSKMANVGATGLTSMIPFIGPFIAPFVGNSVGKALNDSDIDRRRKQLQSQFGSNKQNPSNAQHSDDGRQQIINEFSGTQTQNQRANSSRYSKTRNDLLHNNQQTYAKMQDQLSQFNQKRQNQSKSSLNYLEKQHLITNKNINNSDQQSNNKNIQNAQKALNELSKDEFKSNGQRAKAQKNVEKAIAKATSDSADSQKVILARMQSSKAKISDKDAASQIRSSYKSMRSTINNANNTYNKTKQKANDRYNAITSSAYDLYNNGHHISKQRYNDLMTYAEKERSKSIGKANDSHDKIVGQAQDEHNQVKKESRQQAQDHLDNVNTETGQVLGKWRYFGKLLGQEWQSESKKFHKWVQHPFRNTFKGIGNLWNKQKDGGIGQTSQSHQKLLQQARIPKNQWGAYNNIISNESGWRTNVGANNPNSPYGLGQALGAERNNLFKNYGTSPVDQLKWLQNYFKRRYNGNATNAVRHRTQTQESPQGPWFGNGGWSSSPAIFGEVSGQPEVAINPAKPSADSLIQQAIQARSKYNKSQANKRATQSMQGDIGEMMNKQGNSAQKPIQVNQTINISGNASKETARNIGQSTKQAIKQVIDEYFGEKNDSIFNS